MLFVPPLHAPPRLPHCRGRSGDFSFRVPQHLLPRLLQVNAPNNHFDFLETWSKKTKISEWSLRLSVPPCPRTPPRWWQTATRTGARDVEEWSVQYQFWSTYSVVQIDMEEVTWIKTELMQPLTAFIWGAGLTFVWFLYRVTKQLVQNLPLTLMWKLHLVLKTLY